MADLVIVKFDSTHGAQAALSAVQALEEMRYAWVDDIAIVEKHKHGHVSTRTPHASLSGGAWMGGLVGMFVFFWFPPAWFLAGAVGGAAIGAGIGEEIGRAGVDPKLSERVKDSLTNDTSALLLIGVTGDADQMARAFEPHKPVDVIRESIPETAVQNLKEKFSS